MASTPLFGLPYPVASDAPNGPQQLASLATAVETLLADLAGWKPYTVVWTAVSSNPAIGNGSITARYAKLGTTVIYTGRLQAGSTTTFGSGTWLLSLPAAAKTTSPQQLLFPGGAYLYDASTTGNRQAATSLLYDTTHLYLQSPADASVQSAQPFTWASGDYATWTLIYEAASL